MAAIFCRATEIRFICCRPSWLTGLAWFVLDAVAQIDRNKYRRDGVGNSATNAVKFGEICWCFVDKSL